MSAQAVSNANLTNLNRDFLTTGFAPVINYVYDAAAKEIDVTNASTFPAGVATRVVHVHVHDKFGGQVNSFIKPGVGSGADGTITMDLSTLNASKPFDITATVVADDGKLVADGGAYNIGAAGSLGSWDAQKNA